MGLESLLFPAAEEVVTGVVIIDSHAKEVARIDKMEPVMQLSNDGEKEMEVLSVERQLDAFVLACSILKRHGDLCDVGRKAVENCQRRLRIEKTTRKKQKTILDLFERK